MMETMTSHPGWARGTTGWPATRRHTARVLLGGLVVVAGAAAAACAPAGRAAAPAAPAASAPTGAAGAAVPQPNSAGTLTNEGGQVTVKVTWKGRAAGPIFAVALDTHAVDLDGIDLRQLATLRADGAETRPAEWTAPKGGHHREGNLVFPATVAGRPTIGEGTRRVELVIRNVAGVAERTFAWTPS